jgi:ferredoxin
MSPNELRPPDKVWDMGSWAGLADWKRGMPQHYDTASRMLGVVENRILGPSDRLLKQVADAVGVGHTFYRTNAAVLEPREGEQGGQVVPDPFFGGEGPQRTTCIACGGCMMGCRHGAKNTLDLNYLYLAEKHGARVFAETRVVDVKPLAPQSDGSAGTILTSGRPGLIRILGSRTSLSPRCAIRSEPFAFFNPTVGRGRASSCFACRRSRRTSTYAGSACGSGHFANSWQAGARRCPLTSQLRMNSRRSLHHSPVEWP